uniref:Putative secreted peptide n=1 Tax=Rhipicephalus pulchellus TaxID=72859 RepID=L7M8V4_RHIPC
MAVFYVMVSAIALYSCLNSAAMGEETVTGKAQVDHSCDGNEDCEQGLCCYRPDPQSGTVCGTLGTKGAQCSNITLKEYEATSAQPSCRDDDEAAGTAATTETSHSPPYDGGCPCAQDLVCEFDTVEKRSGAEQADAEGLQSSVKLGTCKDAKEQIQLS